MVFWYLCIKNCLHILIKICNNYLCCNETRMRCCTPKKTRLTDEPHAKKASSNMSSPSDPPPSPSDPLPARTSKSEVARILTQITAEYESAQRGLTGLALGTSRHDFITKRMENMSTLCTELHTLIGDDAIHLVSQRLDNPQQLQ